MSSKISIQIENISKCYEIYATPHDRLKQFILPRRRYYQEHWAIKNISLEIRRGETLGLIGRNGSGKSTLLQLISGILTPTTGEIHVRGRVAAILELGAGFNFEFTGIENIYLNALVLGFKKHEIDSRLQAICDFADIGKFIHQPLKTYSSGMVVRLAFAIVANINADILIIDEALSVGDPFFVQKCQRFLKDFSKRGTLILVSHDTGAILNLCQKVLWLNQGSVEAQGSPKEVVPRYLQSLYEAEDSRYLSHAPSAQEFGIGHATLTTVQLSDENGNILSALSGGERVKLTIEGKIKDQLSQPIVGFLIKDSLGQTVFGDNTYRSYAHSPVTFNPDTCFKSTFDFIMPIMPNGDYMIAAAIADGHQDHHVQHHWIHEALSFRIHSTQPCQGVVGIPMNHIELRTL